MNTNYNMGFEESDVSKLFDTDFKLLKIKASFMGRDFVDIDFNMPTNNERCYHSLLIGPNGVGKSSLLRDIIDIFIEAQSWSRYLKPRKNAVQIKYLEYQINENVYALERSKNGCLLFKNNKPADYDDMEFPMIIASSMGLFDKFPANNSNSISSSSRYNHKNYCYVGPKASSNMFMSKMNNLLRPLSKINSSISIKDAKYIENAFRHIGYEPILLFEYDLTQSLSKADKRMVSKTLKVGSLELEIRDPGNKFLYQTQMNLCAYNIQKFDSYNISQLYTYRQNKMFSKLKCKIKTSDGTFIDFDDISSGEFNLLIMMLNIILLDSPNHLLVLLDEPEISQHPNWQIDIVGMLDEALNQYHSHIITATHSHFLVSNLPLGRSEVIDIDKDKDGNVTIEKIQQSTYGWSSEEVLLKVFKMATDRSKYLAELVGEFLQALGSDTITIDEVKNKLSFLQQVSTNLSEVDPMKKVINSIVKEFNS